ncbi:MAG: hypothetical protein LQ342_008158 [Letrouitia transgressa]|nr:MAG: hypothetical protein LQ342_008158 [Letrouitia transgressa]
MPATQSPAFAKAVEESRTLKQKPETQELLDQTDGEKQLYALFKQGTQDPPFEQAEKPGMFDLKNKAKYNAWSAIAEQGLSADEAQERYVKLVESLKEKYGVEA